MVCHCISIDLRNKQAWQSCINIYSVFNSKLGKDNRMLHIYTVYRKTTQFVYVSSGFEEALSNTHYVYSEINVFLGIDFKIKTVEVEGKKIKLQIW